MIAVDEERMSVLQWALPDNPVIDAVRVIVIGLAVILILWLLRVGVTRQLDPGTARPYDGNERFTRRCFIAMAGAALLAITQEVEQIGKPMVWWRLPLILLIMAASTAALREKL